MDWAGEHGCTFATQSMSFVAKYSPVEPESAFARCETEFSLVTVEKISLEGATVLKDEEEEISLDEVW